MDSGLAPAVLSQGPGLAAWRYCRFWFIAVLLLLISVGTVNALIDPYDVFGTPRIIGLSARKPDANRHGALAKTYQVERVRPRTVLLGASRVDVGLDPASRIWPISMRPVFNYGIDGASLATIYDNLREAAAGGRLKYAVVMVDFELFWFPDPPRSIPSEIERRYLLAPSGGPNPDRFMQHIRDVFRATLSLDAFADSIDAILQQHASIASDLTPLGFTTDGQFRRAVKTGGYGSLFAQKDELIVAQTLRAAQNLKTWSGDLPNLNTLREIVAFCRSRKIELILVIPPFHSRLLDLFRQDGLWPWFETYKRDLAALVPKDGGPSVQLWDFSGYNEYSADKVPALNDRKTIPRWYWEYDHFKPALGEKMLERILGAGSSDFGRQINASATHEGDATWHPSRPL